MWIVLSIFSALCLGFYDVSKKQSLIRNSVIKVLFLSVLCSSFILLPFILLSRAGILSADSLFFVPNISLQDHLFVLLKSMLVLSSWYFAYLAIQHLPITIVAPMNATRPMWTLIGALVIFGERLSVWQWVGVLTILAAFFAFSVIGKLEGIQFNSNIYIWCLFLAIMLGAASGLYDKHLMQQINHNAVQVYYTLYQAFLMLIVFLIDTLVHKESNLSANIKWNWWIIGISVFLVLSDFFYLLALTYQDSLISVVSTTRRCGVIIPFLYGAIVLHDKNVWIKAFCLLFVLLGMICLLFATI